MPEKRLSGPVSTACKQQDHRGCNGYTPEGRDTYVCCCVCRHEPTPKHVHVIPVDATLTADEAWHELCLMGVRATNTGSETWAAIECLDDECEGIASE